MPQIKSRSSVVRYDLRIVGYEIDPGTWHFCPEAGDYLVALYFFDTRDDERFAKDDLGLEIASLDEMKVEAARALAELAVDVVPRSSRSTLSIEVRDSEGLVFKAVIAFEAVVFR